MKASTRKPTKAAAAKSDGAAVGSAVSWSGSSRRTVTSPPTAGASNDVTR